MGADQINKVSLMLSLQGLHDGQNHTSFSKELLTLSAMGADTMSSFSSPTAEQKELLHVTVVFRVLESKSSALIDVPSIH